jgi:hypothetical protein
MSDQNEPDNFLNDNSQGDENKYVEKYNDHPLSGNVFFFITKKTEKIVTAVYMVTSLLEDLDPVRSQVRNQAVLLLEDVFGCLESPVRHRSATLSQSIITIEHILSLFDIAHKMGSVSDMNLSILRKELLLLQSSLHREFEDDESSIDTYKEPHTELNYHNRLQNFFEESYEEIKMLENNRNKTNDIKDTKMSVKKDVVYNQKKSFIAPQNQKTITETSNVKEARINKIIGIIKDKKKVSMKDIATRITHCTEKTLQRDLATLIKQGRVEKQGEKRWSYYVYKH